MKTIATRILRLVPRRAAGDDTPVPALSNLAMPEPPASVLVVDDEEPVRLYVDRILTAAGYRTTLAADCADALLAVTRERFDLLLTDVMMPEMTGAALATRMRETVPDLKVLYLTGHTDRLFEEKARLSQQEAFLAKPCTANALRQAVSLAITGRVGGPVPAESAG